MSAIEPRLSRLDDPAEGNAFTQLVKKYGVARVQAVSDIRAGFPVSLLRDTSKFFDLSLAQIRKIPGVPSTTALNWARQNTNIGYRGIGTRLANGGRRSHVAVDVFGGEEGAKRWLTSPNRSLQGNSPLEFRH